MDAIKDMINSELVLRLCDPTKHDLGGTEFEVDDDFKEAFKCVVMANVFKKLTDVIDDGVSTNHMNEFLEGIAKIPNIKGADFSNRDYRAWKAMWEKCSNVRILRNSSGVKSTVSEEFKFKFLLEDFKNKDEKYISASCGCLFDFLYEAIKTYSEENIKSDSIGGVYRAAEDQSKQIYYISSEKMEDVIEKIWKLTDGRELWAAIMLNAHERILELLHKMIVDQGLDEYMEHLYNIGKLSESVEMKKRWMNMENVVFIHPYFVHLYLALIEMMIEYFKPLSFDRQLRSVKFKKLEEYWECLNSVAVAMSEFCVVAVLESILSYKDLNDRSTKLYEIVKKFEEYYMQYCE